MKVKTTIFVLGANKGADVYLTKGEFVLSKNITEKPELRYLYEYEFSDAIRFKTNSKFNTIIISKFETETFSNLYANLNVLQKFKLQWLHDNHHFQKHWQFYTATIFVPFFSWLGIVGSGKFQTILRWVGNLLELI